MRKIEKLLDKLNKKERMSLLEAIKSLFSETAERLDVKKIKSTNFYRLRTGRFRINFHCNREKKIIDKIKKRAYNKVVLLVFSNAESGVKFSLEPKCAYLFLYHQ